MLAINVGLVCAAVNFAPKDEPINTFAGLAAFGSWILTVSRNCRATLVPLFAAAMRAAGICAETASPTTAEPTPEEVWRLTSGGRHLPRSWQIAIASWLVVGFLVVKVAFRLAEREIASGNPIAIAQADEGLQKYKPQEAKPAPVSADDPHATPRQWLRGMALESHLQQLIGKGILQSDGGQMSIMANITEEDLLGAGLNAQEAERFLRGAKKLIMEGEEKAKQEQHQKAHKAQLEGQEAKWQEKRERELAAKQQEKEQAAADAKQQEAKPPPQEV